MVRHTLVTLLSASLVGCLAGPKSTLLDAPPSHLSAPIQRCFSAPGTDEAICSAALQQALETQDRSLAGRLLVAASKTAAEHSATLGLAGLWLEPAAIATPALRSLIEQLQSKALPPRPASAPGTLSLGPQPPEPIADAFHVPLSMPTEDEAAGDRIAMLLASGCGAKVAHWSSSTAPEEARYVAAAPLLSRLAGVTLPAIVSSHEAALRLAEADDALRQGRGATAYRLLGEAIAALPETAPPCTVRGVLAMLRLTLAPLADAGHDPDALQTLADTCNAENLSGREATEARLLTEWVFVNQHIANISDPLRHPTRWQSPPQRELAARELREMAESQPPHRQALLEGFALRIASSAPSPSPLCHLGEGQTATGTHTDHATEWIARAGRDDLAWTRWTDPVLAVTPLHEGAVRRLVTQLERPEHRWVRQTVAVGALERHWRTLRGAPAAALPLCQFATSTLTDSIDRDRAPGWEERNLRRLQLALRSTLPACNPDTTTRRVLQRIISRVVSEGATDERILSLVWSLTTDFVLTLIGPHNAIHPHIATIFYRELQSLSSQLETQPDTELARALIELAQVTFGWIRGYEPNPMGALGEASQTFAALGDAATGASESPLERLAPTLHLSAEVFMSVIETLDPKLEPSPKRLERLEAHLELGVQRLLEHLELNENQTAPLARIIGFLPSFAQGLMAGDGPSLSAAFQQLEQVTADAPGEGPAGNLWLPAARLALWDVLAFTAYGADQREVCRDALLQAATLADQALDQDQSEGTPPPPGGIVVQALPLLHHAFAAALAGQDIAGIATAVEAPAEKLLSRLEARYPNPEPGSLEAVATQLISALKQAKRTPSALAGALDSLTSDPSGWGVALLSTIQAALLRPSDPVAAQRAILQAGTSAAQQGEQQLEFVPQALQAGWQLSEKRSHDDAITTLEQLTGSDGTSPTCQQMRPALGLLPGLMWGYHRTGQPERALETYERYLSLVDSGFSGGGELICSAAIQRGTVQVSASFATPIERLVTDPLGRGDLDLSIAATQIPGSNQGLHCQIHQAAGRRSATLIETHLLAAAIAIAHNDPTRTHRALNRATFEGRLLLSGNAPVLPPDELRALNASRARVSLPLLASMAVIARTAGHPHAAQEIEDVATALANQQGTQLADVLANSGLPRRLAGLERQGALFSLIEAWFAVGPESPLAPLEKAARRATRALHWVPSFATQLTLAVTEARLGKVDLAAARTDGQSDEARGFAAATWLGLDTLMNVAAKGKPATLEAVEAAVNGLARYRLYGELTGLAIRLSEVAARAGDPQLAADTLVAALARSPVEHTAAYRAQLQIHQLGALLEAQRWEEALEAADHVLATLSGRIAVGTELELRLSQVNLLGATGRMQRLKVQAQTLRRMLLASLGEIHPVVFNLGALLAALHVDIPAYNLERELEELIATGERLEGVDESKLFVRQLRAQLNNPDASHALAGAFLSRLFAPRAAPVQPQ